MGYGQRTNGFGQTIDQNGQAISGGSTANGKPANVPDEVWQKHLASQGPVVDPMGPANADRDASNKQVADLLAYVKERDAPMLAMRGDALKQLSALNANPNSVKLLPGYREGMAEGIGAVDASGSANNSLMSGAHQKRLVRFGGDYFNQKFGEQQNRIMAMLGLGQTAVGQTNALVGQGTALGVGANTAHSGDFTSWATGQYANDTAARTARRGQDMQMYSSVLGLL